MTEPTQQTPLRLWPMMIIVVLTVIGMAVIMSPVLGGIARFLIMMIVPIGGGLFTLIWCLSRSRLGWTERLLLAFAPFLMALPASLVVHESVIITLFFYGVPLAVTMLTVGLWASRLAAPGARIAVTLAFVALGWGAFGLIRIGGFDGSFRPEIAWRWAPTSEDRAAARRVAASDGTDAPALQLTASDWPTFRGPGSNSHAAGAADIDWSSPPREVWRTPVGPGWSSFAHVDGYLFTQEQRGDDEAIICLDADTGDEVWVYQYPTRFTEVISGSGPRATPTFADGRLFATGARGMLVCLDAATGRVHWQRDLEDELGAPVPEWGFSSTPLVTDGVVITYAGASDGQGLLAYRVDDGEPAWNTDASGSNYASAQPAILDGEAMILFTGADGIFAVDPSDGTVLWRHRPDAWRGTPIVQPQTIGETDLLVPLGDEVGLARLSVTRDTDDEWQITERWASRRLKPGFNDYVYHDGAIYGFDGSIFTCLNAETGALSWRGGRYGFGQVLLLTDSETLVVQAEAGEVIVLAADASERRELVTFEALDGKTWNHPVMVDNRLFVRNGAESVCFEFRPVTVN